MPTADDLEMDCGRNAEALRCVFRGIRTWGSHVSAISQVDEDTRKFVRYAETIWYCARFVVPLQHENDKSILCRRRIVSSADGVLVGGNGPDDAGIFDSGDQ